MGILAIDFGGTRTRAAWFDDSMQLITRSDALSRVGDPQGEVIARLIETARQVVPTGESPRVIGISAPGPLDARSGVILHAETLPGWRDVPLGHLVSEAFSGARTVMDNDANLGAVAEYHAGERAGSDPLVYMTISTGIGGGAVINGRLFTGAGGLAIEPGHVLLTLPDGRVKKLEELASGTGIAAMTRERLYIDDAPSSLRALDAVDAKAVGAAALAGDALAVEMVRAAGRWLGLGLVDVLHLLNPQAIVLGGSVTLLGDLLFEPMRETIRRHVLHPDFFPDGLISLSRFGDDVCLWGAALHAATHQPG